MTGGLDASTETGAAGLAALLANPGRALVGFDYDGTLAPIVDDPEAAVMLAGMRSALAGLAALVGAVAIVTGRPARTAVRLGDLDGEPGLERLAVLGQYGVERWDGARREFSSVDPPAGLEAVRREIREVVAEAGVHDAYFEDKRLAIGVHLRRSRSPAQAMDRLAGPLRALAARYDLAVEPGRFVIEIRPTGMDKGRALTALAREVDAETMLFAGDDLGDLAAFDAVDAWRAGGRAGVLVCSGSDEVTELAARADLVVDGPPGILAFVTTLTAALRRHPR